MLPFFFPCFSYFPFSGQPAFATRGSRLFPSARFVFVRQVSPGTAFLPLPEVYLLPCLWRLPGQTCRPHFSFSVFRRFIFLSYSPFDRPEPFADNARSFLSATSGGTFAYTRIFPHVHSSTTYFPLQNSQPKNKTVPKNGHIFRDGSFVLVSVYLP